MSLKKFVNTSFLGLSMSLSSYFLYYLSPNPIVQILCVITAIMYELGNRYILAAAKTCLKKGQLFTACILLFFYTVYIIYNILSSAGFFITEMATQDVIIEQSEILNKINLEKVAEYNNTINILSQALAVEVKSSYRSRSETIMSERKQAIEKRDELLQGLSKNVNTNKPIAKNPFKDLAQIFGVPTNKFAGWVWMAVMAGVCVILIITSEELPEEKPKKGGNVTNKVSPLQTKKTTVTPVTSHVTSVTPDLCICGCGKPRTGESMYYSNACKTRLYRTKKKNEVR